MPLLKIAEEAGTELITLKEAEHTMKMLKSKRFAKRSKTLAKSAQKNQTSK